MSKDATGVTRVLGLAILIAMFITGCGTSQNTNPPALTTSAENMLKQEEALGKQEVRTQDNSNITAAKDSVPKSLTGESMISASQLDEGLKAKEDWQVIDVREPSEFAAGHVPQAINIPLGSIEAQISGISKEKDVILICRTGVRAFSAWQTLVGKGYEQQHLKVLVGGMVQWQSLGSGEVTDSIWGC